MRTPSAAFWWGFRKGSAQGAFLGATTVLFLWAAIGVPEETHTTRIFVFLAAALLALSAATLERIRNAENSND